MVDRQGPGDLRPERADKWDGKTGADHASDLGRRVEVRMKAA
jgi:hypothetical protein